MKVTIIKSDNTVYIDGVVAHVDCSEFPRYFHALQWDGVTGEVEFVTDNDGHRMPNLKISDISAFQHWLNEHAREIAKAEAEAAKKINPTEASGGMHAFEE